MTGLFANPMTWIVGSFCIFVAIIVKLWPKIAPALDGYIDNVRRAIQLAKSDKERANELVLEAQKARQEAVAKVESILEQTRREVDSAKALCEEKLQEYAVLKEQVALQTIAFMEQTCLSEFKSDLVNEVETIVEEYLRNKASDQEKIAFNDEAVKKLVS